MMSVALDQTVHGNGQEEAGGNGAISLVTVEAELFEHSTDDLTTPHLVSMPSLFTPESSPLSSAPSSPRPTLTTSNEALSGHTPYLLPPRKKRKLSHNLWKAISLSTHEADAYEPLNGYESFLPNTSVSQRLFLSHVDLPPFPRGMAEAHYFKPHPRTLDALMVRYPSAAPEMLFQSFDSDDERGETQRRCYSEHDVFEEDEDGELVLVEKSKLLSSSLSSAKKQIAKTKKQTAKKRVYSWDESSGDEFDSPSPSRYQYHTVEYGLEFDDEVDGEDDYRDTDYKGHGEPKPKLSGSKRKVKKFSTFKPKGLTPQKSTKPFVSTSYPTMLVPGQVFPRTPADEEDDRVLLFVGRMQDLMMPGLYDLASEGLGHDSCAARASRVRVRKANTRHIEERLNLQRPRKQEQGIEVGQEQHQGIEVGYEPDSQQDAVEPTKTARLHTLALSTGELSVGDEAVLPVNAHHANTEGELRKLGWAARLFLNGPEGKFAPIPYTGYAANFSGYFVGEESDGTEEDGSDRYAYPPRLYSRNREDGWLEESGDDAEQNQGFNTVPDLDHDETHANRLSASPQTPQPSPVHPSASPKPSMKVLGKRKATLPSLSRSTTPTSSSFHGTGNLAKNDDTNLKSHSVVTSMPSSTSLNSISSPSSQLYRPTLPPPSPETQNLITSFISEGFSLQEKLFCGALKWDDLELAEKERVEKAEMVIKVFRGFGGIASSSSLSQKQQRNQRLQIDSVSTSSSPSNVNLPEQDASMQQSHSHPTPDRLESEPTSGKTLLASETDSETMLDSFENRLGLNPIAVKGTDTKFSSEFNALKVDNDTIYVHRRSTSTIKKKSNNQTGKKRGEKVIRGGWRTGSESYYCHQCRTKSNRLYMSCCSMNDSSCKLKYCERCITNRYSAVQFDPDRTDFLCFRCTGTCNCDICCRRRDEAYVPSHRFSAGAPPRVNVGEENQNLQLIANPTRLSLPRRSKGKTRAAGDFGEDEEEDSRFDSNLPVRKKGIQPLTIDVQVSESSVIPWGLMYNLEGMAIAETYVTSIDQSDTVVLARPYVAISTCNVPQFRRSDGVDEDVPQAEVERNDGRESDQGKMDTDMDTSDPSAPLFLVSNSPDNHDVVSQSEQDNDDRQIVAQAILEDLIDKSGK